MRSNGVRNVLATVSALALLTAASGAMAQASDPLVQLMIKKKFITTSEAAGLKTRDDLAQLLVRKKYITAQEAAGLPPPPPPVIVAAPPPASVVAAPPPPLIAAAPPGSPFSFRIGSVNVKVGGYLDFQTIVRSSNSFSTSGASTGTNFNQVPFSNTVAGHSQDVRLTAQNTLFNIKATSSFWGNNVTAFAEMDFNGNDANGVFINSNSHTPRLRLAYANVARGPFDFTAGQVYSWVTPNRVGLSTDPMDVFTTYSYDSNYVVGLTWARQAAVRAVWHPNQNLAMGVSLENPDQFIGNPGEVIFPSAFNAQLSGQGDNGSTNGVPNVAPDVIPKIAYDASLGGMRLHAEALGLFRWLRVTNLPALSSGVATFQHHDAITKAGGLNANLEVFPGFTLVANGLYGEAIGRYAGQTGPDFVVKPVAVPNGFDTNISAVVGASGVIGAEWFFTPDNLLAFYGGASWFDRNWVFDPTSGVLNARVGFGGPNSGNNNTRFIKEATLHYNHTFWQDPQYGALQAGAQFSVVVREPWFVPAGAPKDAIAKIGIVDMRYVLP